MNAVQLLPGVFVLPDGSARGPGLDAALQCAADVTTLDAWAAALPQVCGMGTLISMRPTRRGVHVVAVHAATGSTTYLGWGPTPAEARRAAADAIRNGRVTP